VKARAELVPRSAAVATAAAVPQRPWPQRVRWLPLRLPWFLPQGRRLPEEAWRQRHKGLTLLLWAHIPVLFVFAVLRGFSATDAALECSVLLVPAAAALLPQWSRNLRSASTSLGLVIAASIFVHFAGGIIEAHFQFFVVLAFLVLYQSWTPFLVALAYVVLEHGIIGVIDPQAVYNTPAAAAHPWTLAALHGGFVLAASFGNLLAWRLTENEAVRDRLTGLPNRSAFLDALDKTMGRRRMATAVLFIDLDNFKDANDAFGHDVGDLLLQATATRLLNAIRTGDLLARLGGDEFAVVLAGLQDRAEGLAAAGRLLGHLSESFRIDGLDLSVSASVGLAYGDEAPSSTALLRNADLAMYEAKRRGGRRVCEYEPALHAVALRRTELEAELRGALKRDEFVVHYQPIFDLSSGQLVGTEALVRWAHPSRGLVPPGDFIPAAERSGVIVPMGLWVLQTACHQTAAWQAMHPGNVPLTVSVNLSARQLASSGLYSNVVEALGSSGLEPSSLCLEITEGSVIRDFEATLATLNELKTLGVALALDDFGTGYSSLSHLQRLPVDSVKIDRGFVDGLDDDNHNARIVVAIIDLAHALGMSATAEGAETDVQLATLRDMQCDLVQGFVLGRPVSADELGPLMLAGSAAVATPPTAIRASA
jgi:diguanylate cyclase (GGDEF)-like protein